MFHWLIKALRFWDRRNSADREAHRHSREALEPLLGVDVLEERRVLAAPTAIVIAPDQVAENTDPTFTLTVTEDPDGVKDQDQYSYTLVNDPASDNDKFTLQNGNELVLDGESLDFEQQDSYVLNVEVDDNGETSQFDLTITVTDVNEPPTAIRLDGGTQDSVAENSPAAEIGVLTVEDPDGDNFNANDLSVNDARFQIFTNAGDLKLRLADGVQLNHETEPSIALQVTATDKGGQSYTETLTILVSDVNEPPTGITLTGDTVQENQAGAVVGVLEVVDPDNETYAPEDFTVDDNRFEVVQDGNDLKLKLTDQTSLDFETVGPSIAVVVTAVDQGGLQTTQTLTITVQDVNEPPTGIILNGQPVQENSSGAVVGPIAVLDPDNETYAPGDFSISDSRFEVADLNGQLTLKLLDSESLDYETDGASFTIEVAATDQGGASVTETLTINVADVNEPPTDIALTGGAVTENQAGATVGTLAVSDPENETFAPDDLSVNDSRFEIVDNGGQLTLKLVDGQALDFEADGPSLALEITATDSAANTLTETFTIQVTDANEPPTGVTLTGDTVPENQAGAVVGALQVQDPDGETFTASDLAVNDSRFEIVDNGGAIQLKLTNATSLDFETDGPTIVIEVTATDQGNASVTETLTITVTDVNEPPTALTLNGQAVAENALGAEVGPITVTDPDNETYSPASFTIDDSRFEVAEVNGQLTLKLLDNQSLDFETDGPSFAIEVTATDAGANSITETFTIEVSDLNEPPTDIELNASPVAENQAGATVGTLTVSDPESETFTAGDLSVNDARFEIVENGGQLTLKLLDAEALDFETDGPSLAVEITATDSADNTLTETFTIQVTDVNEPPNAILIDNDSVDENAAGATVGTLTVDDPDSPGNAFGKYDFSTTDPRFVINNRDLLLAPGVSLDHEASDTVTVVVTATDQQGDFTISQTLTISVNDVNEAPTAISLDNNTVAEDVNGAVVGVIDVADEDASDEPFGQHTFTVSDNRFEVASVNGQQVLRLKADQAVDFEAEFQNGMAEIPVTVTATDGGGLNRVQHFTIVVLDSAETMVVPLTPAVNGPVRLVREVDANTNEDLLRAVDSNNVDVVAPHRYDSVTGVQVLGSTGDDVLIVDATALQPIVKPVSFAGGDGDDTLVGPNLDGNLWVLKGDNQGELNNLGETGAITFNSVENVTGGTGTDRFDLRSGSLDGVLTDTGGEIRKVSSGEFELQDAAAPGAVLSVLAGTLRIEGAAVVGDASVANAAVLGGAGSLSATRLTTADGAVYSFTGEDYLDIRITGQVGPDAGNAASRPVLSLDDLTGVDAGEEFILIDNDLSDASNIRFVDGNGQLLDEGSVVGQINGSNIYVSYRGGDGNDVVLVVEGAVTFQIDSGAPTQSTLEVVDGYLEFTTDGAVTPQRRLAVATTAIFIEGSPSDDSLVLRYGSFPAAIPVSFNGNGGDNRLEVRSGPLDTLRHELQGDDSGAVDLNHQDGLGQFEITYSNLSLVRLAPAAVQHVILDLPADADDTLLSDDAATTNLTGTARLFSRDGQFAETLFSHPTGSLTVRGDEGALEIGDMASDPLPFEGDLLINRRTSPDGLDVTFSEPLQLSGRVHVAAANIDLEAPLTAARIGLVSSGDTTFHAAASAVTTVSVDAANVVDATPQGAWAVAAPQLAIRSDASVGSAGSPFKTLDLKVLAIEVNDANGEVVLSNRRTGNASFVIGPVQLEQANPNSPVTLNTIRVGDDVAVSAEPGLGLVSPSPGQFPLADSNQPGIDQEIPAAGLKPLIIDGNASITADLGDAGGAGYTYTVNWLPESNQDPADILSPTDPVDQGGLSSRQRLTFSREYISANPDPNNPEAPIPVDITVRLPESITLIDETTQDLISENTVRVLFDPISFGLPIVPVVTTEPPPPPRLFNPPVDRGAQFQGNPVQRQTEPIDFASGQGNPGAQDTRQFVLRVVVGVGEDAREVDFDVELPSRLLNLNELFEQLPDDHYRLYLLEGNTRRLIKDFVLKDHRELELEELGSDAEAIAELEEEETPVAEGVGPHAAQPSGPPPDGPAMVAPASGPEADGASSPSQPPPTDASQAPPPSTAATAAASLTAAVAAGGWRRRADAALSAAAEDGRLSKAARLLRRAQRRRD